MIQWVHQLCIAELIVILVLNYRQFTTTKIERGDIECLLVLASVSQEGTNKVKLTKYSKTRVRHFSV